MARVMGGLHDRAVCAACIAAFCVDALVRHKADWHHALTPFLWYHRCRGDADLLIVGAMCWWMAL